MSASCAGVGAPVVADEQSRLRTRRARCNSSTGSCSFACADGWCKNHDGQPEARMSCGMLGIRTAKVVKPPMLPMFHRQSELFIRVDKLRAWAAGWSMLVQSGTGVAEAGGAGGKAVEWIRGVGVDGRGWRSRCWQPTLANGPTTATVAGVPVLKNPIVALAAMGAWSESNRKLYNF